MSKMISVASGFQYSVNIGYDLNNDDKLKNFIPTKSALMLLKDILSSTALDATERARVLVGAYGKGKSHIILTILSVLMQRDRSLFTHLMPKINEDPELKQLVDNYYSDKKNRILPVIINGTSGSLPQAFLLALQRTLDENGLDIMPETNYRAAINAIQKWKADYPKTYDKFKKEISLPVDAFISELNDYNAAIYSEFEEVYPKLTSGSIFNPFVGFDVVELYESVVKSLKQRGYLGIYVVYDEFSKFLESNITAASVSDTKMLQDFAEKCNRSSENELHLLLISHKEISNYIDQLPKAKVDGWRGVSERFRHIHLNNNFAQTYEIISTVIIKDRDKWEDFQDNNKARFDQLMSRYAEHVDYLSSSIVTRGIIVYDEAPVTDAAGSSEDEYDDYAQRDYEAVFNRVIELDSDLKDFINAVRAIVPPQAREMDQLKYQVQEENLYARERVIQMYLRFAVRIALQRAETYDCEISDTIQESTYRYTIFQG